MDRTLDYPLLSWSWAPDVYEMSQSLRCGTSAPSITVGTPASDTRRRMAVMSWFHQLDAALAAPDIVERETGQNTLRVLPGWHYR